MEIQFELLLIWQLSPDQPVGHWQLLVFPLSVQVPPFWQGVTAHVLTPKIK